MAGTYLFIDGNYLDQAYKSLIEPFFGKPGELDFMAVRGHFSATRVYYYNSYDTRPRAGETPEQTEARIEGLKQRFDAINAVSCYHVQLGTVAGAKKRNRRQKQVDVWLAVDALLHAINKNMAAVTLLAGDLDFKPLVKALVQLGIFTTVAYERRSAAKDLYRAADQAQEFTLRQAWEWSTKEFREANPLPHVSTSGPAPAGVDRVVNTGIWNGRQVRLFKRDADSHYFLYVSAVGKEHSMTVACSDLALLEKYFKDTYGNYVWEGETT
jgi:uncharacterized LabA/DUF88 family protein